MLATFYLSTRYSIKKDYKTGDKKKKYVLSQTSRYLKANKFELYTNKSNKIIESVIKISKKINEVKFNLEILFWVVLFLLVS